MSLLPWGKSPFRLTLFAGLFSTLCAWPAAAADERQTAGVSRAEKGMLLRRESGTTGWHRVGPGDGLPAGDLLLGVAGTVIESKDGAVSLQLRTDFHSPLPVLEPAVVLHPAGEYDLDFTLDRGWVDVTNKKKEGAARVHLRAWGQTWDVTLVDPGSRLSIELAGRWPAGTPFKANPGPRDVPSADMQFLALAGSVYVKHGPVQVLMKAPPGPALLSWNNFTGMEGSRHYLAKLPDWAADAADNPEWKKRKEIREHLIQGLATKSPGEVTDEFLRSDDPQYRKVGAILAGALDDLPRLAKVLNESRHADLWDSAVVVLRHWLGRAPGQDQKLYQALQASKGYTPVQAETVIEFLHGFSHNDRERPETYEMLIDYLADDKLAVRGLAYWHLKRLVPAGEKIPYDPLAPKAEREKARAEWKKLVPPGKMPPKPEENKKP
jgi:hypothetical protein